MPKNRYDWTFGERLRFELIGAVVVGVVVVVVLAIRN
jgi:hypothetical protein